MSNEAQFGIPSEAPVWNDDHWWWWDGAEWLLGTDYGWQRPADLEPVAAATPEAAPEPAPESSPAIDSSALIPLIAPTVVESNVLPQIDSSVLSKPRSTPRGPGRGHLSQGFVVTLVVLFLVGVIGAAILWRTGTGGRSNGAPVTNPTPTGTAGTTSTVGANLADWSVKHPPAPGYPAGSAFVLAPGLPLVNGKAGARYINVVTTNQIITAFRFNVAPGSTVATTNFALAHELPSDARVVDARTQTACEISHFTSQSLAKVVGSWDQSGSIVVIFRSPTVTFDPKNIAFADVSVTASIPDHC